MKQDKQYLKQLWEHYIVQKVVAVGDPIQIEPVVTLESHLIDNIRKNYHVPEYLVSKEASVQSVADNANQYGFGNLMLLIVIKNMDRHTFMGAQTMFKTYVHDS